MLMISGWADASLSEYFEQLFTVNCLSEQFQTTGLQVVDADPLINETVPCLDRIKEAVARLSGRKVAGICIISAELLKAGGKTMIRGLYAVLTAV